MTAQHTQTYGWDTMKAVLTALNAYIEKLKKIHTSELIEVSKTERSKLT